MQEDLNRAGVILDAAGLSPVLFPLAFTDDALGPVDFPLDLPDSIAALYMNGFVQNPKDKKKGSMRASILLGIDGDLTKAIPLLGDGKIKLYPKPLQLEEATPVAWFCYSARDMETEEEYSFYIQEGDMQTKITPMDWKSVFESVLARKVGIDFRNVFGINVSYPEGIFSRSTMHLYTEPAYRAEVLASLKSLYDQDFKNVDHFPFGVFLYPIETRDPFAPPPPPPPRTKPGEKKETTSIEKHALRHAHWQTKHEVRPQHGIYYKELHKPIDEVGGRSLYQLLMEIRVNVPHTAGAPPKPTKLFASISRYGRFSKKSSDGVVFHYSPSLKAYGARTADHVVSWFNYFFPNLRHKGSTLFYRRLRVIATTVKWDPIEHAPILPSATAHDDANDLLTTGDIGFLFNLSAMVETDKQAFEPGEADTALLKAIAAHAGASIKSGNSEEASATPATKKSILRTRKVTIGPTTKRIIPGLPNRFSTQAGRGGGGGSVISRLSSLAGSNADSIAGTAVTGATTASTKVKLTNMEAALAAERVRNEALELRNESMERRMAAMEALMHAQAAPGTDPPLGLNSHTGQENAGGTQ